MAVVRRRHFEAIGATLIGHKRYLNHPLFHLWHPPARSESRFSPPDKLWLCWRHATAYGRPELMATVTDEWLGPERAVECVALRASIVRTGFEECPPRAFDWMAAYWHNGGDPKPNVCVQMAYMRHGQALRNWWRW